MSEVETTKNTKKSVNIDYNKEFSDHLRCPNCSRKTTGVAEYKNIKSGKVTKTCKKCRDSVYKSLKKKPRIKHKPITQKETIAFYKTLIDTIPSEVLKLHITLNPELVNDRYKSLLPKESKDTTTPQISIFSEEIKKD